MGADGGSVTVRANTVGTCYVFADVDSYGAVISVRALPLPFANGCSSNSECAEDVPLCLKSDLGGMCGRTCTRQCKVDADCPSTSSCDASRQVCSTLTRAVVELEYD